MAKYSNNSKGRLEACHNDLQLIFNTVVMGFDNSILCGHRGEKEQNESYINGKSNVQFPHGKHNSNPSMAVDSAPYPINWKDRERITYYAGYVMGVAESLRHQGLVTHKLRWGGDWDSDTEVSDNNFDDLVHFELIGE